MRSRVRYALLAAALTLTPVFAQPPAKKDEPKLKIGDPAPPLTVSKWHQGPEVKAFEKGKVYVVVFWEAFSGDPHALLRTVNALQAEHKDVIPVAVASATINGHIRPPYSKREAELVANAKPKFTFAFGDDDDGATVKAYGADGLEHRLFVVGKDGTVAFVAPPHGGNVLGPKPTDFLPGVLPKVLDGSWKGQKDADAVADAEKEYQKALDLTANREEYARILYLEPAKRNEALQKQAAGMLKAVDDFLKTHPTFATQPRVLLYRADKAVLSGQKELAAKAVDAVIADAAARGVVSTLMSVANIVGSRHLSGMLKPELSAEKLVGDVIDAALKFDLSPLEVPNYEQLMSSSLMAGDQARGNAVVEKILANTPADQVAGRKRRLTEMFDRQVKEFEEQRKRREGK